MRVQIAFKVFAYPQFTIHPGKVDRSKAQPLQKVVVGGNTAKTNTTTANVETKPA